ncbi:MAG: hypothetical protein Q9224_002786, partial [Gallowayella concinna]
MTGGPQAAITSWTMVSTISCFLALALAEIAAALPTAGGIYFWAFCLGGPRWGPFLSWLTAWWNWSAWVLAVPGTQLGATKFLISALQIHYPDAAVLYEGWFTWLLIVVGLLIALLPNITSQRWLQRYFRLAIAVFFILFFLFWFWFPIAASGKFRSATFVFRTFNNGINLGEKKQASDAYCWVISLLFGAWEFGGYDASAHLAEETKDASKNVARGMWMSTFSTAILSIPTLILILFCIQDFDALISATYANNWAEFLVQVIGPSGATAILVMNWIDCTCATAAVILSAQRVTFAISRDNILPGSSFFKKVNAGNHIPVNAALLVVFIAGAVSCSVFGSSVAFGAITATTVKLRTSSMEPRLAVPPDWMLYHPLDYISVHSPASATSFPSHAGDAELFSHLLGGRHFCLDNRVVLTFWLGWPALVQGAKQNDITGASGDACVRVSGFLEEEYRVTHLTTSIVNPTGCQQVDTTVGVFIVVNHEHLPKLHGPIRRAVATEMLGVALVTGGATGIGLMAAQTLAVNGARVYIVGRTESKLRTAAEVHGQNIKGAIIPLFADVADKEDIRRLVQEMEKKEEALHILINNAGIYSVAQHPKGSNATEAKENLFDPPNATFDDWADVYRTNAASHYFVTTAFLPLLARGSDPKHPGYQSCVLNISSINGLIRTSLSHFASNAAKAATIHVTKMLAVEIAKMKLHIRVNSIAPGVFPSEITAGTPSMNGKSTLDEAAWPAVKEISSGRVGTAMDMGAAVMFVACCQYLNGVIIPIDGGYLVEHGTLLWSMEPCLFPTLDNAKDGRPGAAQALPFILADDREKLDAFQNAIAPSKWYEVLWALVLRLYVGNDAVAFHVRSNFSDELACGQSVDVCSAEISKSQSVSSIECRHEPLICSNHGCLHEDDCNTTVLYGDQELLNVGITKKRKFNQDAQTFQVGKGLVILFNDSLRSSWMRIHFNTLYYTKETVFNVGHTCRQIFQELLKEPNQVVGDIQGLSDYDLEQILAWNSGDRKSLDSTVHGEFSQHVRNRPDAPALCAWDGSLTYHELDVVTSNLQTHLCDLGLTIGELVPVYFEKSLWAAVAMLGILRAGGAFVPFDPSNPLDRTKAIIKSVNARFILTSSRHYHTFESLGASPIVVDKTFQRTGSASSVSMVDVPSHSPAFVLFTSGSTGQSKGVVQEHGSVCTISKAYGETLHVDYSSRVLQFASYAFDVATVDIFNTLMHGGCVCIPSEFQRKNEIVKVINDMNVNWADITPSFAGIFAPEDVPSLRTVVLAGEEVKKEQVKRWAGKVRLLNCYGPSECGGCTFHEYECSGSSPDTIGRPLPCFKLWVVAEDNVNRLVNIGIVGELLVEGPTLAQGYLDDELRTREAFIEGPAWLPRNKHGEPRRLYRTKDLVRQSADGSFKFVGRSDTQIKVRGQRVELGETEYQLRQYFGTAASVVAFPKTGRYANQLVAVVERCEKTTTHDDDAARTFLRGRLPEYMIPAVWLAIDSIPLSTSLKVDRRRVETLLDGLDAIDTRGSQDRCHVVPLAASDTISHEVSVKVAELVGSRNLESLVGNDVRLAATGFDSIQAITLRMWIKKRFDANVPVSKLTSDAVTISQISALIQQPLVTAPAINLLREVEDVCFGLRSEGARHAKLSQRPAHKAKRVFLTGATGYLGRKILHQLTYGSDIDRVYVLVRCQNRADGHARIAEAMNTSALELPASIKVWSGDLQQTRLGLTDECWNMLTEKVDIIIHNGAVVRWNADYGTLKKANVQSTAELLQALHQSPAHKSFVYVSGGQQLTPSSEDDDEALLLQQAEQASGYAQTKLVSELLVKRVALATPACDDQGLGNHDSFSVIKPSYIIGSPRDGEANTTDYLWRLVAGAVEMKACDRDELDKFLYFSDVETVARVTINAALGEASAEEVGGAKVVKILDG